MLGLLLPILLMVVVGAARVRSLAGLQRLHVHWWPLALGAIALQLVLFNPPVDRQLWAVVWGPWVWVASLSGMLAVLLRNGMGANQARGAWRLAAVGVAVNLFVVLANDGYMPQSPEARLAVKGVALTTEGSLARLQNVAPVGPATRFAWLGDVIAQPAWLPTANVVSIGDLLLSVALAWWAFRVTSSGPRPTQVRRHMADSQ